MANGTKDITMSMIYGGDWTQYSLMTNWFAKFVYHKYYHRLSGRSLSYFIDSESVNVFREKIFMYITHDQNGKKIPELMKGLGSGIKEFKDASKEEETDKKE